MTEQNKITLNRNTMVQYLNKLPEEFTKKDILNFIVDHNFSFLNFHYIGGDGRLKTLNFVINDLEYLDKILTTGERVDGSSLFDFLSASSSDLYVIPKYKTAFVNPFSKEPTLGILCDYYTNQGIPLESSPNSVINKASKQLLEDTGYELYALGELEYYLFSEVDDIFPIVEQKGYHESHPFSKWECVRIEGLKALSQIGCRIKYGHAEVGNIIKDNIEMVQQEIEFLPVPVADAADQMVLAKWALREVAYQFGLKISYAPKIIVGHAGSGMHFHTQLMKDGFNAMADDKGLTDIAKKMIAGFLELSPALSAFGNTVPTSFLRLVPHQEAPTNICWGDTNRSALVRVPLGWIGVDNMILHANPKEDINSISKFDNTQTVELRSPDGSANIHYLLAAMTIAAHYGINKENSLEIAHNLYVDYDVNSEHKKDLQQLPSSCFEAAEALIKTKHIFETNNIFPKGMIDKYALKLKKYNDKNLSEKLFGDSEALHKLVEEHMYCG